RSDRRGPGPHPFVGEATTVQTPPRMRLRKRALFAKFFADRGTHLAAMVAYFALLSFVPLVFLALSLLGLAHRADASDFLVRELKRAFPGSSLQSILTLVHRVQDNAAALGIIGGIGLLWSSLSLFSSLESAFNIVYGRPNRPFLRGKTVAASLMGAIVLEASFQVLPIFVRFADVNVTLRVLGGPAILLLWLYVMANVIVLGAELNWWSARRREASGAALGATPAGVER